ncbi:hypothetical protein EBR43_01615, partial [bacterium]|nr:hypothetical protein [bacterium]
MQIKVLMKVIIKMFKITEETRNAAIEEMREILNLTMEDDEDQGKQFTDQLLTLVGLVLTG